MARFRLDRTKPRRLPRRRFWVFCEGQNTEPAYLRALQNAVRDALIEIEIIPAAGVPRTIADRAIAKSREIAGASRRKAANSYESRDEVWAVFDRDEHPRFAESVSTCRDRKVGVAYSDPCFELWLVLHYEGFDKSCNRLDVQKHLEKLLPTYSRQKGKIPDCVDLILKIGDAEKFATTQLERRASEGLPNGNPSTTFGELTASIRNAADEFRAPRNDS